ncbi:verrucotoxin subunit beta-like [Clarias magur]|uniref:Verrucotoxin subunit beta-like n=1 Tax=Clarias magur TaxID=1594786 RepID=A0A8J4TBG9_CLAMG|nr:verrucotoxin subunit beta-like [Clarias magur]
MEAETIEMAALGRALHPGMLYDRCSDTVIPGISLWDNETIKKGLISHRQPKTDMMFTASDCLSEKAKLLDVSPACTAGILGSLVDVGGSAKVLHDNKPSARQSRVTMQYSQTTRYEEFTLNRNIAYPKVFEDGTATHVVTAVLYGAQAFMVFDLTSEAYENKEEMDKTLNRMVTSIPLSDINVVGGLKMSNTENQLSDKIRCTFYGDCDLDWSPTTYKEALQLYQELPSLLRKREKDAVPIKVWLYPLAQLNKNTATLKREIRKTLIIKAGFILEDLVNGDIQCDDLITNTTVNDFLEVKRRVRTLQSLLQVYKLMFIKALHRLIPAIRSGKEQEQALADVIAIHHKSPFRAEMLNQWFENNESELHLLNLYVKQLSGAPVVKYSALLSNILIDPSVNTVVSFSFTFLTYEDPYLSILTTFLKGAEVKNLPPIPKSTKQSWFHIPELSRTMRENFSCFRSFFQANKDDPDIRFIILSASDPSNLEISTRFYKKGKLVDRAFQPVSKPPAPKVDIQDRNMILSLQKSPTGLTVRFRVEYRTTQATDSEADVEKWEVIETSDAQENFTLTGIMPANQYWVRYRAVSEAGVSEASDSVLIFRQGKLHFSVGQNWNWSTSSFAKGQRLGISHWELSNIKSDVKYPLCKPTQPYFYPITGGLKPGMALFFQGVVPVGSKGFAINLKAGRHEFDENMFHFTTDLSSVVCDTFSNAGWEKQELIEDPMFAEGEPFDIFILVSQLFYNVFVNGRYFHKFRERLTKTNVSIIHISGNVIMNTFAIFQAEDEHCPRKGSSLAEN